MIWIDYTIEQGVDKFCVKGDWPKEVMGYDKDGNPGWKDSVLYKPGEVYIVNEDGWLVKTDDLTALVLKRESKKTK